MDGTNAGALLTTVAETTAAYALQSKQFESVNSWLADSSSTLGAIKHISTGLAMEALAVLQAPLVGPRNKMNNMVQYFESVFNISPQAATFVNQINDLVGQPNIEGIVIFTEKEATKRTMDVSENPMVIQKDIMSTSYVIDNAVPRPRTWSLQGYLTSILPTDQFLVVKPSLILQRNYLDTCMRTRKPVWFKTWDNTFVQVLISDMETSWDPKSMNTMSIGLTLKEFVTLDAGTVPLDKDVMEKGLSGVA